MKYSIGFLILFSMLASGCRMNAIDGVYTSSMPSGGLTSNQYPQFGENHFILAKDTAQSTFGIDVDIASYAIIRKILLEQNTIPPSDAVRIEEMLNYFSYDYPQPQTADPFTITTEVSTCPWETTHKLIHIGLQGKNIPLENLPPSNLVFLIDVSGSMEESDKLPLIKEAFKMFTSQLRPQDRVAIVTYAGNEGLALPSTSGSDKQKILSALDNLEAGGSTNGSAGLNLAY
ncbi:MAG: VWA domain-containing protein, partial [Candidatus Kapaibacterium sp.]